MLPSVTSLRPRPRRRSEAFNFKRTPDIDPVGADSLTESEDDDTSSSSSLEANMGLYDEKRGETRPFEGVRRSRPLVLPRSDSEKSLLASRDSRQWMSEFRPGSKSSSRKDEDSDGDTNTDTDADEDDASSEESDTSDDDQKPAPKPHRQRKKPHLRPINKGGGTRKHGPSYLVYVLIFLFLLLLGGGAYYFFAVKGGFSGSQSGSGSSTSQTPSSTTTPPSLSSTAAVETQSDPFPTTAGSGSSTSSSVPSDTSSATSSASSSTSSGSSSMPSPLFVIYTDKDQTIPAPSALDGFNVLMLAFWTIATKGGADIAEVWVEMDNTSRTALKAQYAAAGVKIMVSCFGSTDAPTTTGADAVATADSIAAFVIQYGLDGADIDYEDLDAMDAGTGAAEQWLIDFTTELRQKLPSPTYLISHAPMAPWFTTGTNYPKGAYLAVHKSVGSMIDFYNIQFFLCGQNNRCLTFVWMEVYNQAGDYANCTTLITTSSSPTFPGTALLQIIASGVDQQKAVLGKPADAADAHPVDYMTAADLAVCVAQAKAKSWSAGLMLWEWPDQDSGFVATAWGT